MNSLDDVPLPEAGAQPQRPWSMASPPAPPTGWQAIGPLRLPHAPASIARGSSLADLLGPVAVDCLAHNIGHAVACLGSADGGSGHPVAPSAWDADAFRRTALDGLAPLGLMDRGHHLAQALHRHLPGPYERTIATLLASLTPPQTATDGLGLGVFFYLPHVSLVARYGQDARHNGGHDPFEVSMRAQHALTRRFSAEFSIRPFLVQQPERTLARLLEWTADPDPHVRRLCSEGCRPRLPWAMRLPALVQDPRPVLPILERLKDDPSLYVRRSVANHLGDIAKDHPEQVFDLCRQWLVGASDERRWLIRHALRHPAKQGHPMALALRHAAKAR